MDSSPTLPEVVPGVGFRIRRWRQRHRYAQEALAERAGIPAQHLAKLESGRSLPEQDTLLRVSDVLNLSLRERNILLAETGLPAVFPDGGFEAPENRPIAHTVRRMLERHDPFPAVAYDRHRTILAMNAGAAVLTEDADPTLAGGDANWVRLLLHPAGLAPRVANLATWRASTIAALQRDLDRSDDRVLAFLINEIAAYPNLPPHGNSVAETGWAVPFTVMTLGGTLSFDVSVARFPAARDVGISELAVEMLHPIDAATEAAMVNAVARRSTAG